ncbi:MAG: hypothetical protein Kow0079_04090 [Vicingaceae bacterium]
MNSIHNFHIPVMGVGYTIDTPIKVAHFGISSVMSIGDDLLAERLRAFYSNKYDKDFIPIEKTEEDYRAKRITAYLNLVDEIINDNFKKLKSLPFGVDNDLTKYFELLPSKSNLYKKYKALESLGFKDISLKKELLKAMQKGAADVNIMTKLDKENYDDNGEKLAYKYNDAHAALRGFAKSNLSSGVVLSAGLNPRLYSYIAELEDFYPDNNGDFKKRIILKVSDFRSALIQGKFLAKKGVWVNEFRIESGLNCGGHAFPTEGMLLGPILEEFKINKQLLIEELFNIYNKALTANNRNALNAPPNILFTVQGGVGTNEEHEFLINYFKVDAVGWGSPFLLVPEVVNIDEYSLNLIAKSTEKELYLSNISPIGIPFNTIKNTSKEKDKNLMIKKGKPGSACTRKYLQLFNKEFSENPLCVSSRQYQNKKIKELATLNLSQKAYDKAYKSITEKECLCTGLVKTVYDKLQLTQKDDGEGISICPGPNIAYFKEVVSLKQMVDHIYGKINLLKDVNRPNMFIKELQAYIDYLKEFMLNQQSRNDMANHKIKTFISNLFKSIEYYKNLFKDNTMLLTQLNNFQKELNKFLI